MEEFVVVPVRFLELDPATGKARTVRIEMQQARVHRCRPPLCLECGRLLLRRTASPA